MPIIRITKKQVEDADLAFKDALSKDHEFKEYIEAQENELQEALELVKKERKEDANES